MSNTKRIVWIDSRLRAGRPLRLAEVADRFETSERQIKRDFEYLRDRLDAPLIWDRSERVYRYDRPWRGLEFTDEKRLLFYVFARAASGTLAYVPLAPDASLERLLELVPKKLRGLAGMIRYELPGFEPADVERISLFLEALRDRRLIDATYRDLEAREVEHRLAPRRIVNYAGTWYCLAWDLGHSQLRMFRLSRFSACSLSKEHAPQGPDEEEVEKHLASSFGMFKGPSPVRAIIRFKGRARLIVRDELWHPEQCRCEGSDDSGDWLDLELPVSHWEEIVGRVLRFGAEAEAVAPPEFRKRWLEAIDAMAALARKLRKAEEESR